MSLDVIRKLLDDSTPEPWRCGLTTSDERIIAFVSDGTGETHADVHAEMHVERDEGEPDANGVLIAELRNHAEALCDLADAARETRDKELPHSGYCATVECHCPSYVRRLDAALARLDDALATEVPS